MIDLGLWRVVLHTSSMTVEKLKEIFPEVTAEEIALYEQIYKMMDVQEAIVVESYFGANEFIFCGATDNEKNKEILYLMEQDPLFGCYIDQREEFDRAYDRNEYVRDGSFCLQAGLVELKEKLGGKGAKTNE